jgi:tripartite-type tricarboxylate transporter receptor subunit TctC
MNRPARLKIVSSALALVFWAVALVQPAISADPFYKGKTIRIVVGFTPGGGFDTFARVLARHLPRYIPGKPSIIVQNIPGGGSMSAANRVYAMQPGDGLTMVAFIYGVAFQYFIDDPKVKFDPTKYHWLGEPTVGSVPTTLFIRSELPIRNLEDLKKSKKPIYLAGSARTNLAGIGAYYLKSIGLPVEPVLGYGGSAPSFAAIERKEADGRISSQESFQTRYKRFLDEGVLRPILAFGSDPRVKHIPGVATEKDLNLDGKELQFVEFLIKTWRHLRIFAMPPGVPPERLATIRKAFDEMLTDPKVIEEGDRQGVRISPSSWQTIEANIKDLSEAPPWIISRYKDLAGIK